MMNATSSHLSAVPPALDAETLRRVGESVTGRALAAAAILVTMGFLMGLGNGPWDQNQLAMLHIPAVWVSMLLLLSAAFWAAIALVLERDAAHVLVQAIVPTGGMFAFLALWSGSLWVRSVHGVWWLGSAREWASLALLTVYLAMLSLPVLLDSRRRADRLVSVLALLGVSQVLLTYFSTEWWTTESGMQRQLVVVAEMLPAMFAVALGLWAYATATAGIRLRSLLLERQLAPTAMARWD